VTKAGRTARAMFRLYAALGFWAAWSAHSSSGLPWAQRPAPWSSVLPWFLSLVGCFGLLLLRRWGAVLVCSLGWCGLEYGAWWLACSADSFAAVVLQVLVLATMAPLTLLVWLSWRSLKKGL
jgi:hypothetical protein